MQTVNLIQGTPEWHAHRAQHFNASDAPAMLGVSPYKTRAQLVREIATGIAPELDAGTLQRFADGHRYEALARPLAEEIIGEDLYPVVGVNGPYSASFDGLTLMEDTAFEHKSLNDTLRAAMVEGCTGADLPEVYRVQNEQQLLVCGGERVLFVASKWNGETLLEERHCWYYPDLELRARIVAGWKQFAADVAAYTPGAVEAPAATGRAPEQLPTLHIAVTGMVTASNLSEFKAQALAVLGGINRDLQTDEDFANAEQTVTWAKGVEDRLEATKDHVLSQTTDIAAVFRTIDEVSAETRRIRLELEKLVKAEKENRKGEIVQAGAREVREHYDAINATLGEHRFQPPQSLMLDLGSAIKGKRSLSSMRDAVHALSAQHKIAASQSAERVRANVAILAEHPDHVSLFADRVQLCANKAPEDLRNLVAARIADHEKREAERLEAEREKIRAEETARIQREAEQARAQQEREEAARRHAVEASTAAPQPAAAPPAPVPAAAPDPVPPTDIAPRIAAAPIAAARVKLGDINAAIEPLSITAEGLARLGFLPVGQERAAKLFAGTDIPMICAAMARVIADAPARVAQKKAA